MSGVQSVLTTGKIRLEDGRDQKGGNKEGLQGARNIQFLDLGAGYTCVPWTKLCPPTNSYVEALIPSGIWGWGL